MLYSDEFPGCCGIVVIYAFDEYTNPKEYNETMTIDRSWRWHSDEERKEAEKTDWASKDLADLEEDCTGSGMILAALADFQWKGWHKWLLKQGYKVVGNKPFYNPRHRSKIRLYQKVIAQAPVVRKGKKKVIGSSL